MAMQIDAADSKQDWGGRDRRRLAVILALFVVLALCFNLIVPVFNAPDETHHFEYIRHLARHAELPDQTSEARATSNEGFNPPLYYAICAVILSLVSPDGASDLVVPDSSDVRRFRQRPYPAAAQPFFPALNPRYLKWGRGRQQNMFLRVDEDHFPFSGSIRAVHLLRAIGIPLGMLTILFVYKAALSLFPDDGELALLAAAICAFNPQFVFVNSYLNNDALVTLFSTLCFWLVVRLVLSRRSDVVGLVVLGTCLGLGLLSKLNIAFWVPIALLAVCLGVRLRGEPAVRMLRDGALFISAVVVICGWYFVRNISLYGLDDPLGWQLRAIQNPELVMDPERRAWFLTQVFPGRIFTSFWGQFDWLTIRLPAWAYASYGAISLMGLVGIGAWARELRARPKFAEGRICLALCLAAIALALGNMITLNFTFLSAQGRLIFPVIAPLCIFIAIGLRSALARHWPPGSRVRERIVLGFILLLVGLNLYALFGVIAPVYA